MSRFLISCGGTGGHLSPGIALAEGLLARGHDAVLLISRKKVDARLIEAYPHLRFERMPGTPFSWNPVGLARCFGSQTRAMGFCLALMARFRPDLIVGFGGFTSAPVVLAGRLRRVSVALHECNRVPGLAVRTLGHLAERVYLPIGLRLAGVGAAVTRHVGLPVRREIVLRPQAEARIALGFDPGRKLLAILGGSQGASVLNDWARRNVELLAAQGIQLFCVTGLGKGEPEVRAIPRQPDGPVRAVFTPFSDRIADVLSASDLVVSRAGAGTLAELVRCETPAILIPYPHAADNHQRANAAFFERQGGGLALSQEMLGNLLGEVRDVIFNEWLLRKFRGNLRRMDRANSLELMLLDLEEMAAGPAARPLAA
ncbi:MAG TPA: UDP-N-acetylglucosamine--N-acetylmuramyl-(pentapeptide) pyrophosphoryl-undecaprenol N-acetylglucosamine transferase [Opitutaceae bacterium]|nr:UDP-N-acetylglucosamine--N-acetylmuramyl-(pentapeptide) pyrophosphoryl-undecaprenol N-acetylglucosamine transferase [Opitutaceae bacterium]